MDRGPKVLPTSAPLRERPSTPGLVRSVLRWPDGVFSLVWAGTPHAYQRQAQIAHLVQQAVQRCLIHDLSR